MSFRETFTREEGKDDVQYDDSAFFTFGGSILLAGIIFFVILIYRRLFYEKSLLNTEKYINCPCKTCQERLKKYYKNIHSKKINLTFYVYVYILIALCYLFYLSYFEIIKNTNSFKSFNPYEILEINPGATEGEIKSAYRKLAKMYHPDRNQNNPQAKGIFILITKAYEALTDEVARKNFEMYGNPDGPGSMRLAVGLPSFVLNKKNHMPILVIFLLIVVLIIPITVWVWFSNSQKYDDSGMHQESSKAFYYYLNENTLPKQMPFVLGNATEFAGLKITSEEVAELSKLYKNNLEHMPKHKDEQIRPQNKKAICLLYAFLDKKEFSNECLYKDLNNILSLSPMLITNMYTMAVQLSAIHAMNKQIKFFGYHCIKTIIEFSQQINQRLGLNSHVLLQLPHFNESRLKNLKSNKETTKLFNQIFNNSSDENSSLAKFINMEDRYKFLSKEFTDDEIKDIEAVCQIIPNYDVEVKFHVEGFGEEILKDDLVTYQIIINRKNLADDKLIGVPHSNNFPEIVEERVVCMFTIDKKIIFETILLIDKNKVVHEFKDMARFSGNIKFQFELYSLNYKGLDIRKDLELKIIESSEARTNFIKDIEKREPKKLEPSYFQQMLQQVIPAQNEEEEEEEADDNEDKIENSGEEVEKEDFPKKSK